MSKTKSNPLRESGVELLRIFMMLQVIYLHVCMFGGFTNIGTNSGGKLGMFFWIVMMLSRCPIYVYMIITGYFSVNSKLSWARPSDIGRKAWKIWAPMIFYSVLLYLVCVPTGLVSVSARETVRVFVPALGGTWYFMTLYLIIIALMPFLNKLLVDLKKRDYLILLGIMVFLFCIWKPVAKIGLFDEIIDIKQIFVTSGGKSLYDMLFMYALGGYLRRYSKSFDKPRCIYLVIFVVLGVINGLVSFYWKDYSTVAMYNDNPISVIQCVCLFLFFRDIKFKSAFVNKISGYTFAVYLIHMDPIFRQVIWGKIFPFTAKAELYTNYWFPFVIMGVILAIFAGCCIADEWRQEMFKGVGVVFGKIRLKNKTDDV